MKKAGRGVSWGGRAAGAAVAATLAILLAATAYPAVRRGVERRRGMKYAEKVRAAVEATLSCRVTPPANSTAAVTEDLPEESARASVVTAETREPAVVTEAAVSRGIGGLLAAGRVSAPEDLPWRPGEPEPAAWESIGGCGVGGSGGAGDVRWVGRRVPGGRIEPEATISYSAGEDLETARLSFKITSQLPNRFTIGLSVPYLYSERWDSDYELLVGEHRPLRVSSLGDVSLLASRKFGMLGNTSVNLSVGLPTADYDLTQDGWHIPYDAQPGRGKMTVSLGVEQVVDKYYGPMIFGGSFNYNGGENDIGDYRSSSVSAFFFASLKTEKLVHSLGGTLTYAFEPDRNLGAEIMDQPQLLFTLQYGLEISAPKYPMFMSLGGTFSKNGLDGYSVSLGVMTAF
ncbi:MAG: hypothetical protein JW909_12590 [Planctomycetes bacterium]|nr:hypothetical protein [Planctomycetota bacterium]